VKDGGVGRREGLECKVTFVRRGGGILSKGGEIIGGDCATSKEVTGGGAVNKI